MFAVAATAAVVVVDYVFVTFAVVFVADFAKKNLIGSIRRKCFFCAFE